MKSMILSAVLMVVSSFALSASADSYPYYYKTIDPATGQLVVIFPRPASTAGQGGWNYIPMCPDSQVQNAEVSGQESLHIKMGISGDPCAEIILVPTAI